MVAQDFKDYVASRGWTYRAEWNWPWKDPETGEHYEGYWSTMIYREELLPSGDLHYRALEVMHDVGERGEDLWKALVDLAQAEFDRNHELLVNA